MATISPSSRRPSPPNTPNDHVGVKPRSTTNSPSDDSSVDDVSFEWSQDSEGNFIRLSKGSSKSNNSSPPTPPDQHPAQHDLLNPKPPSPISLNSPVPVRRASLSRSESGFPALNGGTERANAPRSFQRTSSSNAPATHLASSTTAGNKPQVYPRRVAIQEPANEAPRPRTAEGYCQYDDKENEPEEPVYPKRNSPPLVTRSATSSRMIQSRAAMSATNRGSVDVGQRNVPARQIQPPSTRPGRVVRSASGAAASSIPTSIAAKYASQLAASSQRPPEMDTSESEGGEYVYTERDRGDDTDTEDPAELPSPPQNGPAQGGRHRSYAAIQSQLAPPVIRPRRSASFSDAIPAHEEMHYPMQGQQPPRYSRPGTSQGYYEEDVRSNPKKYRRDMEQPERRSEQVSQVPRSRQSPSPTHQPRNYNHMPASHQLQPRQYGHQRRESETLRTAPNAQVPHSTDGPHHHPYAPSVDMGSPTAVDPPPRSAPFLQPTASGENGNPPRLSPRSIAVQKQHRRSPTAPEIANTDGDSNEKLKEVLQQQQHPAQPSQHPQPAVQASSMAIGRPMVVNRKPYARLDLLGKGGSSRVYRVLTANNELYAIKRVSLDRIDAETMNGYMNEIALLKRLEGNSRIIRLVDSEVKAGPGGSKGHLMLVMECGEIDLARLLSEQIKEPLNLVWVAYYWQQMLQAVHIIHEEKIVHSDLKPANFVLVRGQLKLIDFGIANAIANDTTNIQRDHQIGTVNYMSPEAIELPDGMRRLKVGRPSDVWSLGCILYQMVYGQPPFQQLSVYQKMKAIPDASHAIPFPQYSVPTLTKAGDKQGTPPKKLDHLKVKVRDDVIATMKKCLCRPPKERATIPELLEHEWLTTREAEKETKPRLRDDETIINAHYMRQLLEYGISLGKNGGNISAEDLSARAQNLVAELKALNASS